MRSVHPLFLGRLPRSPKFERTRHDLDPVSKFINMAIDGNYEED